MATKLVFAGIYTQVPGTYSDVDRSGLATMGALPTGVVALLGEGAGGGAGGGTSLLSLENPQAVLDAYRSGPLKEAALIAFDPALDDQVTGASKIIACKVNPAVQAAVTLANADGDALLVTSADYGLHCSQINVQKAAGSLVGVAFNETFEDESNTYDDIGGAAWFQLLYTAGTYDTMTATVGTDASLNPDKVTADATLVEAGQATGIVFTAGDQALVACNVANNGHTVTIYGVDSDGNVNSEAGLIAAGAFTSTKRWQRLTGCTLSAAVAVGNLTVTDTHASPANLTILVAATSVGIVTCTSVPVANRPLAFVVAGGACVDPVVVRGKDLGGSAQVEYVTMAGAATVYSDMSWSQVDSLEVGGVLVARTVTMTARAVDVRVTPTTGAATTHALTCTEVGNFTSGHRARVVAAVADVGFVITLYGLDVAGAYQTATVTTNGADGSVPVFSTATWSKIYVAVSNTYVTGALVVTDETPTTVQTIAVGRKESGLLAGPTRGRHTLNLPVAAATVSLVASGATTRSVLLEGLDTGNAAQWEVLALTGAAPVTSTKTWNRITRIWTGDIEAVRTVTCTTAYTIQGGYTTIQQLADAYNAKDGFTATVVTGAPTTNLISELDVKVTAGGAAARIIYNATVDFKADLTELIRYVNARSSLVVLSRPDGATCVPANTAGAVYLVGGSEGTTLYAHWVAALTKIMSTDEPFHLVVLTDSASVHAALDAHLMQRETTYKREADGFVGMAASQTKAQIKAACLALNTRRIGLCAQELQRYASDGVLTRFAPMYLAAAAAGTEAGAAVGLPLTRRWLKAVDVFQSTTWDPTTDADTMIGYGLLFAQEIPNRGFRWVRGVSTWVKDDNLANCELSVNNEVNVFIRNFREWLDVQIGQPNYAGTMTAVKASALAGLAYAISEGWCVGYRALTFTAVGDAIWISLEVAPTLPLNFIPIALHLVQSLS